MRSVRVVSFGLLATVFVPLALAKEPGPRALDLENAIANADLIMTVRLTEVSEGTVVHGGKEARTTQQFTFEPVRTLKGRFARTALKLTSDDLGANLIADHPTALEKGQMRLLFLGRAGPGYANSNRGESLDLSLPTLANGDDPLIETVRVLIKVTQEPDRVRKVEGLRDGLKNAHGRAAIPLLHALERRAMLAAQTPQMMSALVRVLADADTPARAAAAETVWSVLVADYLNQKLMRDEARTALLTATERGGGTIAMNVALISALAFAADPTRDARAPWLEPNTPKLSFAERAARFRAVGQLRLTDRRQSLSDELALLPVDAPAALEEAIEQSLIKVAGAAAGPALSNRIAVKHAAGLDARFEVARAVNLPPASAATVLLEAVKLPLDIGERIAFASVAGAVHDARLAPILATMLDPRIQALRWHATTALMKIDTDETARILRSHLSEEADLARKLEIGEFLGRHQIRDGYPYAIEHLSEPYLRDRAIAALVAIKDPTTEQELHQILKSSNDLQWTRAAICAFGRLGAKNYTEQFLGYAKDPHHPYYEASILALADLGEPALVPILNNALSSRNNESVATAARAAGTLLAHPGIAADNLRDRLAGLLADTEASQEARAAALLSLVKLRDTRLNRALTTAIRDGRIEGSGLLALIEEQAAKRKVVFATR